MAETKHETNKLGCLPTAGLFITGIFLIAIIYWIYLILSQPGFWYLVCILACLGVAGYGCHAGVTYDPDQLRQKRWQIVLIVAGLIVGSISSFGIGHWLDKGKPDAEIANIPSQNPITDATIVSPAVNTAAQNSSSADQESQATQQNQAPIVANTEQPKIAGQSPPEAETQPPSTNSAEITEQPSVEQTEFKKGEVVQAAGRALVFDSIKMWENEDLDKDETLAFAGLHPHITVIEQGTRLKIFNNNDYEAIWFAHVLDGQYAGKHGWIRQTFLEKNGTVASVPEPEAAIEMRREILAKQTELEPTTLNGKGNQATKTIKLKAGQALIKYSIYNNNDGNFIIELRNTNGDVIEPIANEIVSKVDESQVVTIPVDGLYLFNIQASGLWRISVEQN